MAISDVLKTVYQMDWSKLTFLECGAFQEGLETCGFTESSDKWYIEGNPKDFDILKTKHTNSLNYLLSDKNTDIDFFVTSLPGNSSINHSKEHLYELKIKNTSIEKISVKAITYQYLISNIIKHKINVLVLDIEGHETTVLKTFAQLERINLPEIIIIECGYDWLSRLSLLHQLGYREDFYYYNNCYLTLNDHPIIKNQNKIREYNNQWPQFVWNNTVIYKNNLR